MALKGPAVTQEPRRRAPRASRLMVDLFESIAACDDVVEYWDAGKHVDGVLVRVRSRQRFATEPAASEAAALIAKRLIPAGYDVLEQVAVGRPEGMVGHFGEDGAGRWHAYVELVLA